MIEVKKITFAYNNEEVLKDISFNIKKGTWVSIIGHNGSGKSTLARLLVGLLEADFGSIIIDGITLTEETLHEVRKKIGIVFQNPDNQFVGVTVKHDIAFGLENKQVPRNEMIEIIDKYATLVGMNDLLNKEPHNLSGGQKQRVAIAGTLAMEQEIIIFDEATSMLDPKGTKDIVNLIETLNKTHNKTVITITHDLDFARLSDHIIVLKEGQIIKEGAASFVFEDKEILESTDLELPYGLRVYNEVINNPKLSKNELLVKTLWEYNLRK